MLNGRSRASDECRTVWIRYKGGNSKVIYSRHADSGEVIGCLMKHWPGLIDDCEIYVMNDGGGSNKNNGDANSGL
jgi:hypothetical protein